MCIRDSKNIYYEIHGEGEPLVMVNGIMMSCDSWLPFKEVLSSRYKLVIFDMVDQGRSDKMTDDAPYTQDYHVEIDVYKRQELEDEMRLSALREAAKMGIAEIDAGAFRSFESADALGLHLTALTAEVISS